MRCSSTPAGLRKSSVRGGCGGMTVSGSCAVTRVYACEWPVVLLFLCLHLLLLCLCWCNSMRTVYEVSADVPRLSACIGSRTCRRRLEYYGLSSPVSRERPCMRQCMRKGQCLHIASVIHARTGAFGRADALTRTRTPTGADHWYCAIVSSQNETSPPKGPCTQPEGLVSIFFVL